MKAAPFDYTLAGSLDEVITALADGGDEAMVIAGGQTLVPMMAMRLARPAILIDINEIEALRGIERRGDAVHIRSCTRQCDAMADATIAHDLPLLAKALPYIGHQQTRNRGTVGGSVAHGDPAAEIPLIAVALEATITLHATTGVREIVADAFFEGPMMTARGPSECLAEVRFPVWSDTGRLGVGFQEVSERHGDFAIVAAAAQIQLDADGRCTRAAIAVGGASGTPINIQAAGEALLGAAVDATAAEAAASEVDAAIDPDDDSHAGAGYRRRVARHLVAQVILDAARDAA